MHSAGLSSEVLLAKINSAACDFDTSPGALAALKKAGMDDAVILAMIGKSSKSASASNDANPRVQASSDADVVLHFYREKAFVGSARKMPIYIDEVKVADLVNGRQFTMTVGAAKHVFRCQTKEEAIAIKLEPAHEYYLRAELIQSFTKNHWHLVEVSQQQGETDVQALKPLDPSDIVPAARSQN